MLNSKGTVYLDYRKDVMRLLEESDQKPDKGQDLREILYRDSLFVPRPLPSDGVEERGSRVEGRIKSVPRTYEMDKSPKWKAGDSSWE